MGVVLIGVAAVPCVFTTRTADVFVLPKLTGLWGVLALAFVVLAVGVLLGQPTGGRLRWIPSVDVAVIALVSLNVLATAFSTDRHQSLFGERFQYQGLLTVLLYVGYFGLARHVFVDRRRLELLFAAVAAGAVLVAGYALAQKAGHDPIWHGVLPQGRVFSSLGQPNSLAAYLVLAVAPTAYFARLASGVLRALLVAAVTVLIVAIALTQSRGGFLGLAFVVVVAVAALAARHVYVRRAVGVVAFVGVLVVLALPAGRDAVSEANDDLRARGGQGELSMQNHVDTWRVALRIAAEHPVLGTGPETFPDVFPAYSREVLSAERVAYFDQYRVESPHNVYLGAAATTGVPALAAYLVVIGGSLFVTLRAAGEAADPRYRLALFTVAVAVGAHLVTDTFMSPEITGTWLSWMLIGAGLGTISSRTDARPRPQGR
jgi:O-antigen ligase